MKIKRKDVWEILQRIYDSEIDLHIWYLWDWGWDYALYNTPCPISWVPEKEVQFTWERSVENALGIIVDNILQEFPNSTFTKWFKDSYK